MDYRGEGAASGGLAVHGRIAAATTTNAGLTALRFRSGSANAEPILVKFRMSLATAALPADTAELRAFALACQGGLKPAELLSTEGAGD